MADCANCPYNKYCYTNPDEWGDTTPEEMEKIIAQMRACFLERIRESSGKKTYTFKISYN
ncbi:MAG: hypothetical protein V2A78_08565 [bacterium]